jgi:hypothetical protein
MAFHPIRKILTMKVAAGIERHGISDAVKCSIN